MAIFKPKFLIAPSKVVWLKFVYAASVKHASVLFLILHKKMMYFVAETFLKSTLCLNPIVFFFE